MASLMQIWTWITKTGKFLHLVEDDLAHLSMSGMQLWASTYVNIEQLWYSHDHMTQAVAAGSNGIAAALHAVKRAQTNAMAVVPTIDPPWKGEAD